MGSLRPELEQRVDEALAAGRAASDALHDGNLDRAAAHHRDAERRFEALVADDPDELAHRQALGAQRYAAGETHLARGDLAEAVAVLGRAQTAYEELGERGGPDVAPWIADVRIRRARGLLRQGRRASALVESQAAALTYMWRWNGDARHPNALETARVLAWHAFLTARCGDPDLAVAAADTALIVYVQRADDLNASLELRLPHLPQYVLAARIAAVIHDAHGRTDLASAAAEMASLPAPMAVEAADLPTAAEVRAALTLAEALDRTDARELRSQLTAPAEDCRLLTPADRCAPDLAPALASRLADLATQTDDRAAILRLSLEAHAMFAHASEARVLSMRYQGGHWGAAWADLARRASQTCHEAGLAELADDFGEWMMGAVQLLGPHVLVDPDARAAARRCTVWQGRYAAAIGDEKAARAARESLEALDARDL